MIRRPFPPESFNKSQAPNASKRQEEYLCKNSKQLEAYTSPQQSRNNVDFNQSILSPDELMTQIINYAKTVGQNNFKSQVTELNLHDKKLEIDGQEITLDQLYSLLLENILMLHLGFQRLWEDAVPLQQIIFFFSRSDVQISLKSELIKYLNVQKKNKRTKADIWLSTVKHIKKCLINQLMYALNHKDISFDTAHFWMNFSETWSIWKKATEEYKIFEKRVPGCNSNEYLPWLVVIKRRLQEIETNNPFLLQVAYKETIDNYLNALCEWFTSCELQNLLTWFWNFLFNECNEDPKEKFLFIHGETNVGKTFFMNTLFRSKEFLLKHRNFSYFGNEKAGTFKCHALIFDDPGKALGKSNQLNTSVIMNLANTNVERSLPAKYGFLKLVNSFHVVMISNQKPEELFEKDALKAIESRLIKVHFKDPYPLKIPNNQTKPFKPMRTQYENGRFVLEKNFCDFLLRSDEDFDFDLECLEKPFSHHLSESLEVESNEIVLTEDLLFYFNWVALLGIFKANCANQDVLNLQTNIPNGKLRTHATNLDISSFYDIICSVSDEELTQMVTIK